MNGILRSSPTIKKKGSGSVDHAEQLHQKEIDILVDRFSEYKSITKGLISYYDDIAKLENHTASELQRIGGHLPVPLREGNQFLPQGGWQSILSDTRDRTRQIAEHHATFAHNITSTTIHTLNHVKADIKSFTQELENEPRKLAIEVGNHRAESTRKICHLSQGIANSKSNPQTLTAKDDPVLLHRQVEAQLKEQLNHENSLTKMIIEYQKKAAELEKRLITDIQIAAKEFESARMAKLDADSKEWQAIHSEITTLDPQLEWDEYAKRSGHIIPEDAPTRDPAKITFPGQDDETTRPVKDGLLERKKRFTKHYKEAYYVLTPSGFLHEHKSSDPVKHAEPELSIFLPNCILGPPAPEGAKTFKWHVEGKKNTSSGHRTGSLFKMKNTLHIGKKDIAFSFKARSHAEMTHWWELMQHPAKASYTAATLKSSLPSETVTRKDGEITEDELGGSSDEEESAHSPDELSTAPTTPPFTHRAYAEPTAEVLPVYKGGDYPEAALADLKEKPEMPTRTLAKPSTS
ncbi:hypothetical protein O181_047123 [Austropuccinia psidii MF-1]|uniref:PH domain-containing protein n=1 Tax=Austropuccinia psidii MF-1 TaxID=1389203 RepID=A0A9Q3DTK0_9BASI|nr:hypothetical protein [Austropuccinia psidii MF-1]